MSFRDDLVQICQEFPEFKFEFRFKEWETDFCRFYQSQINYNISKTSFSLQANIYKGKKYYGFEMVNPNKDLLLEKIEEVKKIIDRLPEDPDFVDLEDDLTKTDEKEKINNIEKISLAEKIEILKKIAAAVESYNFNIFGTFVANYQNIYFVNSNGLNKKETSSPVMLNLKAVHKETEVTVLESFGGENFAGFNLDSFLKNLLLKVEAAKKEIVDVESGEYEVILAPRCIGEYFDYLESSINAASLDSGRSFFEGKLNKRIFPESITLIDSPSDAEMIRHDYNYDGHIYKEVILIENGVFKNFLVGNYYAHKLKMKKTGGIGDSLIMKPGNKSLEEMIAGIKHGLYISNLHYMNFINPKETSLTGLTRDGTFLIENGKITRVVNNLRFTEKISDILNGITEIENKNYVVPSSSNYGTFNIYTMKMPHVKVKNFKISSSTKTI